MSALSPSQVEYEIISLSRENLEKFLTVIQWALDNFMAFNMHQAWVFIVFKVGEGDGV